MIDWWADFVGSSAHWKWLSFAVILGVLELLVPGVLLIWVAAAAALVGVVTLVTGMALPGQLVLFALLTIVFTYAARRWYRDNPVPSEDPLLNDRAGRMIGQIAQVVEPVDATGGRVKVGDSVWPARGPVMAEGSKARISAVIDGVVQIEAL